MTPDNAIWWLRLKAKQKQTQKYEGPIYQGGTLPVTDITAEAPMWLKHKQAWEKENPFDLNKYIEDRFNNPVGREAIKRIDEKDWRKQLKQEGLQKRQQELDEETKMVLTNTVKGTDWKIVKDFKGKPKHSNGGVDITISDKGITMRRGGKDIKAKYGLLIPNNN